MLKGLKRQAFALCLLLAVVLAILFPDSGSKGGVLQSEWITKLGIWIIFLLQGLSLPMRDMAAGALPKRVHVFVLLWNFLFFPCVLGLLMWPLAQWLDVGLVTGFWLLAILPTTVSSAVTFTAVSGGHTPNAIFSTVFSNLLAVFIVPGLAVAYLTNGQDASMSLVPIFRQLSLLIILPLVLGQGIRCIVEEVSAAFAKRVKWVSSGIIVFIVHAAFADSVQSGFLDALSLPDLLLVLAGTLLLLGSVSLLVWWSAAWVVSSSDRRISAFYCASQKSLAMGLPLATAVLTVAPDVMDAASVLIPMMCYHPLQLLLAGVLASRLEVAQKMASSS